MTRQKAKLTRATALAATKMANFVPKQNETYVSGTSFRTLLSFLPLLPESVRAEV